MISKKLKSERASVTLFTLIAMLFFLIIALLIYTYTNNKKISQTENIEKIIQNYEKELNYLDSLYYKTIVKQPENAPGLWIATEKADPEWYNYQCNTNAPKLTENMTPIKYAGPESTTQKGSKWANMMTPDGSMFVWIPRYAYKITDKYHQNGVGTIEIAFIDTNNKFLNPEDSGAITEDPTASGAGTTVWLVHPAFTNNAENGGGFGNLSGIWIGKFETTAEYTNNEITNLSVKPATTSLRNQTINYYFKTAQNATFGETTSQKIGAHMAKNSEWGALAYLAYSKYGIKNPDLNLAEIAPNTSTEYITGGNSSEEIIYTTNINQNSTGNAYGIYDMSGSAYEVTASYVNYDDNGSLQTYGETNSGDIYGSENEHSQSTKYKTVYTGVNNNQAQSYNDTENRKGDSIWETSFNHSNDHGSWLDAYAYYPEPENPFFIRGGSIKNLEFTSLFSFSNSSGNADENNSFRMVLAF